MIIKLYDTVDTKQQIPLLCQFSQRSVEVFRFIKVSETDGVENQNRIHTGIQHMIVKLLETSHSSHLKGDKAAV